MEPPQKPVFVCLVGFAEVVQELCNLSAASSAAKTERSTVNLDS